MSALRIVREPTAFSLTSGKTKRPRQHKGDHLAFIRQLPCLITGKRGTVEAAHIRYTDRLYAKENSGGQAKPDDCWTVPLSAAEHRDQHTNNEQNWWAKHGIDPLAVASRLYAVSGDIEAGEMIISEAIRTARGK